MQKLRQMLPTKATYEDFRAAQPKEETPGVPAEPQVGFRVVLEDGKAKNRKEKDRPPELHVTLIGARHLPDGFGFKKAQGYKVKVKLFPGATKYESDIQTSSWPKFDQTFKFQIGAAASSKSKSKSEPPSDNLPEKLFKGNFLVFTVFALLELPVSANTFKEGLTSLKRQGSLLLKKRPLLAKYFSTDDSSSKAPEENANEPEEKPVKPGTPTLTTSESNRNLGSVTYFLDPKHFGRDKNGNYSVEETWLPIKELAMDPKRQLSNPDAQTHASPKGQVEITLAVVTEKPEKAPPEEPVPENGGAVKKGSFKGSFKNFIKGGSKQKDEQFLKISTTRMRCSIRAKEGFEKITNSMYIKTSVFNQDMPSKSWKSDKFAPALSTRCDETSVVLVPLFNREDLKYFNIRVSVATKNNVGKKLVLGEVNIGATSLGSGYDHWQALFNDKNGNPITMWHSFQ